MARDSTQSATAPRESVTASSRCASAPKPWAAPSKRPRKWGRARGSQSRYRLGNTPPERRPWLARSVELDGVGAFYCLDAEPLTQRGEKPFGVPDPETPPHFNRAQPFVFHD